MRKPNAGNLDLLKSKRKLIGAFIGLSIFAFLLVFIAIEIFIEQAFMILLLGPIWPVPELFPAFTLTQLHDIGIALASIGLVFMYLPITLTLVISEALDGTSQRMQTRIVRLFSYSDFSAIIAFFGLFLGCMGVWFCSHQAFLYLGEFVKGTIPSPIYVFLLFELSPIQLHILGNLLVMFGLLFILSISSVKVLIGILAQLGRLK
ncbi:MAG: hypothetical protein ACFFD8_06250 [Candidatus Thorarchaeota archaeon]